MSLLSDVLNQSSIAAFGLGMPVLSPDWCSGGSGAAGDITVVEERMALSVTSPINWNAPLGGQLRKITSPAVLRLTLIRPSGSPLVANGFLLALYPQAYLRLSRLYAKVLEDAGRPERERGLPLRPVPRYFFFEVELAEDERGGQVEPHEAVCEGGEMTVYDDQGFPIDPLAVASALLAIMERHPILQARGPGSDPIDPDNTQLGSIAARAGAITRRVRLSDPSGQPRDNANLSGLEAVPRGNGLFRATGNSVSLNPPSDGFPQAQRRLWWLGPMTTGQLEQSFALPGIPAGVNLARDFFHLRVVQLDTYLLGEPNPSFLGGRMEHRPSVQVNEPVDLLADGNDLLAAASAALTGAPDEALCVAQEIRGDFPAPTAAGEAAHWPAFPVAGGPAAPAGDLRADLRLQFNPTARWLDDGNPDRANVDLILTLHNLPAEAAVRVYPRKFIPGDYDGRGDGAGGVVPGSGTIEIRLPDPLNLRRPGLAEDELFIPEVATLFCDVVIVKRTGEKRIYGNLALTIGQPTPGDPTPSATNPFGTAARRGVSNAGILGLGNVAIFSGDLVDVLVALTGEGNPRDASRFPTMARRDLLAAGHSGGQWSSLLGAGRLASETHSAEPRLGGAPWARRTRDPARGRGHPGRAVGLRHRPHGLPPDEQHRRPTGCAGRIALGRAG
jgi:hypothetical protein